MKSGFRIFKGNEGLSKFELWLFVIPLSFVIILRTVGFHGMVGQDIYAYVDYAKSIRNSILQGGHPGDFYWPAGYPLLGALFSLSGLSVPVTLQVVSCLSISGSLIMVGRILQQNYPESASEYRFIYLVIFGFFAPYYLRISMMTMSDSLATFMTISAVYFAMAYSKSYRFSDLVCFSTLASYAVFVRFSTAIALTIFTFWVIFIWFRYIRKLGHLVVLGLLVMVYYMYDYFKQDPLIFLGDRFLVYWNIRNLFTNVFYTDLGTLIYTMPNIVFVFSPFAHYGFMIPGFLFVVYFLFKERNHNALMYLGIGSYLFYALIIAGSNNQIPRYLLTVYPVVLILCFYGFYHWMKLPYTMSMRRWMLTGLLLSQMILCILSFRFVYSRNALEQEIHRSLVGIQDDYQVLYSFDIDVSLKSRGLILQIENLWKQEFGTFKQGELVLFSEAYLSTQWKDKNPMINWNKLKNNYELILLQEFGQDWKLYQIG